MKGKINRPVMLSGSIQLLSKEDEILKYVPEEVYLKIKNQDSNPCFAMMSLGYEGESTGFLYQGDLADGVEKKQWYKQLWPLKVIKELVILLQSKNINTPVYEVHAVGDDMNKRVAVGSVVASSKRVINNVTHAVVVAYINNYGTRQKIENGEFDSCSIEANCVFEVAKNIFRYIVREVKEVLGIALCNSEKTPPGFKDAHILAVVTAMAKHNKEEEEEDDNDKKGTTKMTLKEIRQYIEENGILADQLFSTETLAKLPKIKDLVDNEIKVHVTKKDEEIAVLKTELIPFKEMGKKAKIVEIIKNSALLKNEKKETVEYLTKIILVDISDVTDVEKQKEKVDSAIKTQLQLMKEVGFEIKSSISKKDEDEDDDDDDDKEKIKTKDKTSAEDLLSSKTNELIPAET